jgi:predicted transcriptional regulator of viral defense system
MVSLPPNPPSAPEYVDSLQASGRYVFTRAQALAATGLEPTALESALRRMRARRRIATPRRGFHVIVPLEYRDSGAPPAAWFVDDLMRHLEQPYYVGLLSAAAIHGAAHQQPMSFQVVTDRPTRPARIGRSRIVFHMSRTVSSTPIAQIQTPTGTLRVSTPEATAFDIVRFAEAAGHIDNVATVLNELAERISPGALAQIAPLQSTPDVQRLGYLLDLVGQRERTGELAHWLSTHRHRAVLLGRGRPEGSTPPDPRWRVRPNVTVEVDS